MNLKKFLPYEAFTVTTQLSAAEVEKRLLDNTDYKKGFKLFWVNNSKNMFEGYVENGHFEISQVPGFRRSNYPKIKGDIMAFGNRTEVTITMRPFISVIIVTSVWMGVVTLVCLGVLLMGMLTFRQIITHGFSPMFLIPFAMFIVGACLIVLPFKAEARHCKVFLIEIWRGKEVEQH